MTLDVIVDGLKYCGTTLSHEKVAGMVGGAGGTALGAAVFGAAATWLTLPLGQVLQEPSLLAMLTSFTAVGYGLATLVAHEKRTSELSMYKPHVSNMHADPYHGCEGKKTNTAHYVAILVSSYVNGDEDRDAMVWHHDNQGRMLENLLKKHEEKGTPFLGVHQVDGGYSVNGAKRADLEKALSDPQVSSIVLIGHSRRGSWAASDPDYELADVGWKDVAEMVRQAGHCKDGFGLQMGCNVVCKEEGDIYPVLTPAFHGHGQGRQIGYTYVRRGKRYKDDGALPGSETTPADYRKAVYINLSRLVPDMTPLITQV